MPFVHAKPWVRKSIPQIECHGSFNKVNFLDFYLHGLSLNNTVAWIIARSPAQEMLGNHPINPAEINECPVGRQIFYNSIDSIPNTHTG